MSTATTVTTFVEGLDAGIGSIAGESEDVLALRLEGSRAFAATGVPTTKNEDWRFTNLKGLASTPHELAGPATADITPWQIADSHRLVFVNGRYSAELSDVGELPDGVTISPLAAALAGGTERAAFALGKGVDLTKHPFAALNTANFVDGAFIHLEPGRRSSRNPSTSSSWRWAATSRPGRRRAPWSRPTPPRRRPSSSTMSEPAARP